MYYILTTLVYANLF